VARVRGLAQAAIHERHLRAGVSIVDPQATVIDVAVTIGADTLIEPFTTIRGSTRIGCRCRIRQSYLLDCELEDGVEVGPFAYLRPGTVLRAGAKAGTFVEVKNSDVGAGAKIPHLSYIGDADVGELTNLGATTITANYDGRAKHRTVIGRDVRTSVDTTLVAPDTLGHHGGRAAARPRHRAPAPDQYRGLRRPRPRGPRVGRPGAGFTLRADMSSAIDTRTQPSRASLPIDYNKRLMLFGGRANPQLAVDIADKLGVELGPVTLKTFSDGEVYCRYEESIRGADVFIVQSICGNAQHGITANDSLMELLFMIDAAVGASAHRVIAVTPWFGYSRQDKKSAPREPISARLVARMLEAAGVDRVLTMDLHAGQIQGFFQKPVDHMTALFMLTQYFGDLGLSDLVVVAPDAGRVKLNKNFASKIGAELAILDKERPAQQVAEIGYVIGDVKGKTAVIVDDMIDTAGTLRAAAKTVFEEGAARAYAAATHAVFSGNAFENLRDSGLQEIVVTDTIPVSVDRPENVRVLPCADLLTDSIRRIFVDDSVSEVFGGENQLF
jgi:ribose-phosphate pyrophosphokinase